MADHFLQLTSVNLNFRLWDSEAPETGQRPSNGRHFATVEVYHDGSAYIRTLREESKEGWPKASLTIPELRQIAADIETAVGRIIQAGAVEPWADESAGGEEEWDQ